MVAQPKRRAAKPTKIPQNALDRARSKVRKQHANPFEMMTRPFPPGVMKSAPKIAQDEAVSDTLTWAATIWSAAAQDGVVFMGYPLLAELAQRPEYRRISETIARHMTRKWISVKAKGDEDKSDKIAKIEDALKRLKVQDAFLKVAEQDGLFGRSHIFLDLGGDVDDRNELKTPIGDGQNSASKAKVSPDKPLLAVKPVEPMWASPLNYNSNDPLRPDWYKPQQWQVFGKELHASRLLTFVGREVPDIFKPVYLFGGLSLSQMAKPYVDNWLRTRQSVADIVSAFSVFVLKTRLYDALNVNNGDDLFDRADFFNRMRDNRGLMMIDKDGEEFENVSASLASLDMLQAQTQEHMAAVSGIPIVVLLGIQPAGLNATSEGELTAFYEWIHSAQETLFRPNLTRILGFIQLSEFGEVDPDITFDFEPLEALNEKEVAETELVRAQTDATLVDAAIIDRSEARQRLASDEDSPYAGLDPEELPDPPQMGAEPQEPPAPNTRLDKL